MRYTATSAWALAALLFAAADAGAQTLEDTLRAKFNAREASIQFQSLINFTAVPDIAAATYRVDADPQSDGAEIRKIEVPLRHDFDRRVLWGSLYGELSLGYLTAEEISIISDISGPTFVDNKWRSYSVMAGVGLSIPLGAGTRLRPLLLGGYANFRNDAEFSGPLAALLPALDGLAFNLQMDAWLAGDALELENVRGVGAVEMRSVLRFNHIYSRVYNATAREMEVGAHHGTLNLLVHLRGPTALALAGRPVEWTGLAGGQHIFGNDGAALGFSSLLELGGGFNVVFGADGRRHVGLVGTVIAGDGVTGWSIGLNLKF